MLPASVVLNFSPLKLLVLLFVVAQTVDSLGIGIDLNEPPPPEDDFETIPGPEVATTPLSCPAAPTHPAPRDAHTKAMKVPTISSIEKWQRARVKANTAKELPDYCDYEKFKATEEMRKKTKESQGASEKLFRQSLFLKRCLDVFRSRVEYRLGKKTYLEGVTPLTDMSPNEVGRLFMSAPPIEFSHVNEKDYMADLKKLRSHLAEKDLELPSQSSGGDDDDDDDDEDEEAELAKMMEKFKIGQSFAKDSMLVMDSKSVKTMIATMMKSPNSNSDDEEYKLALRDELIGADLDHKSESCADFDDAGRAREPYPEDRQPLSDKRPVGRVSGKLPEHLENAEYEVPDLAKWKRQYLDWGQHRCFHRIYKQFTDCGCCYAFAATNMAEFVSCTEKPNEIKIRKFSEMHALNCGLKYHAHNMHCSGGSVLETLRFIGEAGAYSPSNWKERIKSSAKRKEYTQSVDVNCPMTANQPWHEWGNIKINLNPVVVHANEWLEALEDGPLVATIQMPRDGIVTYSGGVHDGQSCSESKIWHVMILVGYGIDEHGIPYWRFRNTFGPEWGDQGHFNLAMSVPGKCFAGGVRVYREPTESSLR